MNTPKKNTAGAQPAGVRHPVAPAVYKPQPTPKCLQLKKAHVANRLNNASIPRSVAPKPKPVQTIRAVCSRPPSSGCVQRSIVPRGFSRVSRSVSDVRVSVPPTPAPRAIPDRVVPQERLRVSPLERRGVVAQDRREVFPQQRRKKSSTSVLQQPSPSPPPSEVDNSYGPMPGTQGKDWESPKPESKRLDKGLFGYFSPSLNKIVINMTHSEFVQAVTYEHETAHAAHFLMNKLTGKQEDTEFLILTEFTAWWRDALHAVALAEKGEGPTYSDHLGQTVLNDARTYLANPKKGFMDAMMNSYREQIAYYLQKDGIDSTPEEFVRQILNKMKIGRAPNSF